MKYSDKIGKGSKQLDTQIQKPEDKQSFGKKLKTFILHPTVWRIVLLAAAIASTIMTGGAIIPLITVVATAVTSLVSVLGKTLQNRSLERVKMQHGLTKIIEKREEDIQKLRKNHSRVFGLLEKEGGPFAQNIKLHEIKNIRPEHKGWSVARVLSFIGAEQFWTVALFSTAANPVGLAVYICGLVLGTAVIKSEYDYRVTAEQEKSNLKEEINARCKMLNIAEYSDEKGLYSQFRERMINYKSVELLCEEKIDGKTEEEILAKFQEIKSQVSKEIKFVNVPEMVSLGRNFLNAVNPFKDENAVRTFEIDFDEKKLIYEMRSGYKTITPSAEAQHQEHKSFEGIDIHQAKERLSGASARLNHDDKSVPNSASSRIQRDVKKNQKPETSRDL